MLLLRIQQPKVRAPPEGVITFAMPFIAALEIPRYLPLQCKCITRGFIMTCSFTRYSFTGVPSTKASGRRSSTNGSLHMQLIQNTLCSKEVFHFSSITLKTGNVCFRRTTLLAGYIPMRWTISQ